MNHEGHLNAQDIDMSLQYSSVYNGVTISAMALALGVTMIMTVSSSSKNNEISKNEYLVKT